ncbi:MAG: hypothetical protein IKX31_10660 [Muribaculaceae bacterium]|nr:hypothetical protein [Muribaculaceae bacterium]
MPSIDNKNDKKQLVTVVIPLYQNSLSEIERWAVTRNLKMLSPERDIAVVCPNDLDLSPLSELLGLDKGRCRVERFAPEFFEGRKGYNHLMLSHEFYSRFVKSHFILICQTDVALFCDNLDYWCSLDYDYIGAPWLPAQSDVEGWNLPRRAVYILRRGWARAKGGFSPALIKWKVGNGGFSLRRVDAMLQVIDNHRKEIENIVSNADDVSCFEDVVWGVRANEEWNAGLNIPDAITAAHFAFEGHPDFAYRLTNGKLPMGAHAFYRRRNRPFWLKHMDFNTKA